ncbi:MAG: hypothetical protein HY093_04470 [Candidatus Liptonbacteria bacterium]|nr:hypothetical protein [Candidatus Liptonbacteria bacterium]
MVKEKEGQIGGWSFWRLKISRGAKRGIWFLAPVVLLGLLAPQMARAQAGFLLDLSYKFIGGAFFVISWLIGVIAGIAIAVEAWVIEVVLNMNTQIINSTPVKFGFPIALSITNLGFVAAIIVIAIATILRLQSYGIKQILWKLIVAALLVNFSLVFAGAILNFADQLTLYFLNQVNPASQGASGGAFSNFASGVAGAFNPQRNILLNKGSATPDSRDVENLAGSGSPIGAEIGKLILPIVSSVFVLLMMLAAVITLGAFIVMLVIRYVTIGILLILMPFVWLLWIFPNLKSHWSQWWSSFLKQVFFAPLVVFFLYLALLTSTAITNNSDGSLNLSTYANPTNPTWGGISSFFTSLFSPIISNAMQQVVILGIMLGGLVAADKLGIAGAAAGMTAFQKSGNWVKEKSGRAAGRTAAWAARKAGAQRLAERTTQKVAGYTPTNVFGKAGKWVAGFGARGVTGLATKAGEDQVKQYAEQVSKKSVGELRARVISALGAEKIAIINELTKRKELGGVNIHSVLNDSTKSQFLQAGQKEAFEKVEKAFMTNVEMAELLRKGADKDTIAETAKEFYKTFSKKDAATMHADDMYSEKDKFGLDATTKKRLGDVAARAMAMSAPMVTPNVMSGMKSQNLERFGTSYQGALTEETGKVDFRLDTLRRTPPVGMDPVEVKNEISKLEKIQDSLKKTAANFESSLAKNATGLGGGSGAAGGGSSGGGGGTT